MPDDDIKTLELLEAQLANLRSGHTRLIGGENRLPQSEEVVHPAVQEEGIPWLTEHSPENPGECAALVDDVHAHPEASQHVDRLLAEAAEIESQIARQEWLDGIALDRRAQLDEQRRFYQENYWYQ